MKVFELMDELIEELESSPKALFSNKRSVDLDVVSEIISDLKNALPPELEEATQILREKDEILAAAREEAASIIKSAEDELNSRVCEETVMQEAEACAKQLLAQAESNLVNARYDYLQARARYLRAIGAPATQGEALPAPGTDQQGSTPGEPGAAAQP